MSQRFHSIAAADVNDPLSLACKYGNLGKLIDLHKNGRNRLEQKVHVMFRGNIFNNVTLMWIACTFNQVKIAKYLIKNASNIHEVPITHTSPLRAACYTGFAKIVRLLLKNNANVNDKNKKGETALMCACYFNQFEVVKTLLTAGADAEHISEEQMSAIDVAAKRGSLECIKILLNHDKSLFKKSLNNPYILALKSGHHLTTQFFESIPNFLSNSDKISKFELCSITYGPTSQETADSYAIAISMRVEENITDTFQNGSQIESIEGIAEAKTLQDLNNIILIPNPKPRLALETAFRRERWLGINDINTLRAIVIRATHLVVANEGSCSTSLKLLKLVLDNCTADASKSRFIITACVNVFSRIFTTNQKELLKKHHDIILQCFSHCLSCIEEAPGKTEGADIINAYFEAAVSDLITSCSRIISLLLKINLGEETLSLAKRLISSRRGKQDNKSILHIVANGSFFNKHVGKHRGYFLDSSVPDPNVIRYLIERAGAEPNSVDNNNRTALHTVCTNSLLSSMKDTKSLIEFFLQKQVHADLRDCDGNTFIDLIQQNNLLNTYLGKKVFIAEPNLQCITANFIAKESINFTNLPLGLKAFVNTHKQSKP